MNGRIARPLVAGAYVWTVFDASPRHFHSCICSQTAHASIQTSLIVAFLTVILISHYYTMLACRFANHTWRTHSSMRSFWSAPPWGVWSLHWRKMEGTPISGTNIAIALSLLLMKNCCCCQYYCPFFFFFFCSTSNLKIEIPTGSI